MMEPQTQLLSLNARIQGYPVSTLTVFYNVKHRYEQEDTCASQSLMEIITLILPLEATTFNNPNDSRSKNGVKSGVTVKQQQERW